MFLQIFSDTQVKYGNYFKRIRTIIDKNLKDLDHTHTHTYFLLNFILSSIFVIF